MNAYDVIIVGSGLGGLVCGNILSNEGFKVCVLEKNPIPGGCLQSYKRRGNIIDTGIHYVGCLDEGQLLSQYFKYLKIMDKLKIKRLDADGFDIINIRGKVYKHAMGHENFIETLTKDFPEERGNIGKIVSKFKEIGDLINLENLRKNRAFSLPGLPYFNMSAAQFIKENTPDFDLQLALAGTSNLCGGIESMASLYVFSTITNSNIESAYRFVDGSQQVADLLIENIRSNGGEVRLDAEVTRFQTENDLISSVEINGEEVIHAKHFISNINPEKTLALTDKTRFIKKAYISRIKSLKQSVGFFTVSVVFKDDAFEYLNRNYYYHNDRNLWPVTTGKQKRGQKMLFCTSATSNTGKYAKVAHILEPMDWEEMLPWVDTKVEQRGDDYKAFKQQRAELLIEEINKHHPTFKASIEKYYTSTPLTYRDYTGTKEGTAYGIVKDCNNALVTFIPAKSRIPNLYFTGQNNNVHGMIGVMLTAMYTCSEFIGMSNLAQKVGNA